MTPEFVARSLNFKHFDRSRRFKIKIFGAKIGRLDYAIFRVETDRIFPKFTEEERAAWAIHAALTHPGFK